MWLSKKIFISKIFLLTLLLFVALCMIKDPMSGIIQKLGSLYLHSCMAHIEITSFAQRSYEQCWNEFQATFMNLRPNLHQ